MSYYIHRTESGRAYGPCMCGAPDCRSCGPAQGYPPGYTGDDEPYTEADAIWDATGELFANVDGCAATLHNAMPDAPVHHVTVDGDWLSDEADMAQCLACLLQSDDDEHIAAAAYRLRTLLAESKDGAEFVATRAKELLDEEAKRQQKREREAREQAFADDGSWQ